MARALAYDLARETYRLDARADVGGNPSRERAASGAR